MRSNLSKPSQSHTHARSAQHVELFGSEVAIGKTSDPNQTCAALKANGASWTARMVCGLEAATGMPLMSSHEVFRDAGMAAEAKRAKAAGFYDFAIDERVTGDNLQDHYAQFQYNGRALYLADDVKNNPDVLGAGVSHRLYLNVGVPYDGTAFWSARISLHSAELFQETQQYFRGLDSELGGLVNYDGSRYFDNYFQIYTNTDPKFVQRTDNLANMDDLFPIGVDLNFFLQ
jgi:hypothetical protein